MARYAALGGALALLLLTSSVALAYPELHVMALSQRADRASVAPGDVFVLTIHAKIAQRRDRLDELILGSFENCEIISNETVRSVAPDGTDFVERLTLEALAPGEATISPAYIDAVDPTLGKPLRFSSNPVRVHVTGGAPPGLDWSALAERGRRLLLAITIVASFAAATFVIAVLFWRRRKRRTVEPAPVPSAPAMTVVASAPPVPPDARLLEAVAEFRATRSAQSLADLRGALFALARVERGATLLDALRSLGERDRPLRLALLAAEAATFGPDGARAAAGDELLAAVAAYLAVGTGVAARADAADAWTR